MRLGIRAPQKHRTNGSLHAPSTPAGAFPVAFFEWLPLPPFAPRMRPPAFCLWIRLPATFPGFAYACAWEETFSCRQVLLFHYFAYQVPYLSINVSSSYVVRSCLESKVGAEFMFGLPVVSARVCQIRCMSSRHNPQLLDYLTPLVKKI